MVQGFVWWHLMTFWGREKAALAMANRTPLVCQPGPGSTSPCSRTCWDRLLLQKVPRKPAVVILWGVGKQLFTMRYLTSSMLYVTWYMISAHTIWYAYYAVCHDSLHVYIYMYIYSVCMHMPWIYTTQIFVPYLLWHVEMHIHRSSPFDNATHSSPRNSPDHSRWW